MSPRDPGADPSAQSRPLGPGARVAARLDTATDGETLRAPFAFLEGGGRRAGPVVPDAGPESWAHLLHRGDHLVAVVGTWMIRRHRHHGDAASAVWLDLVREAARDQEAAAWLTLHLAIQAQHQAALDRLMDAAWAQGAHDVLTWLRTIHPTPAPRWAGLLSRWAASRRVLRVLPYAAATLVSARASERAVLVAGLAAFGDGALPTALSLLEGSRVQIRAAGLDLVAAIRDPAALPALHAARARERSKKLGPEIDDVIDVLSQLPAKPLSAYGPGADQDRAVDARLATLANPDLAAPEEPAPRWREGGPMSSAAWAVFQRWLGAGFTPELLVVATRLDPGSMAEAVAAWVAAPARPAAARGIGLFGDVDAIRALGTTGPDALTRGADPAALVDGLLHQQTAAGARALVSWQSHPRLRGASWSHLPQIIDHVKDLLPAHQGDVALPRLGFDDRGERSLDLGARAVELVLDHTNTVRVRAPGGELARSLPRRPRGADATRWNQGRAEFKALQRQIKDALARHTRQLEGALISGRRWPPWLWSAMFPDHPLGGTFARSLLFTTGEQTFFVSEEGELLDQDLELVQLPTDGGIALAHPAELDAPAQQAWLALQADAGITPPFPQLQRPVFRPGDPDPFVSAAREAGQLYAFTLHGRLKRDGWTRGPVDEGGRVHDHSCAVTDRVRVCLDHTPLPVQMRWTPRDMEARVRTVRLMGGGADGHLPPRVYSEAVTLFRRLLGLG